MKSFPLPQFIQLYPTTRCNQNCSFCFNSLHSPVIDMSPDNALNLLDIMSNLGINDLDIMGGEPFLLPWMPSFINTVIKEEITVNISTNGSFPEIMDQFRGLEPGRINIGISLEGSSAEKHNHITCSRNYNKALSTISSLVSMGLNPIVKTVVDRQTMSDIQDIITVLKQAGVKRYYLIHRDLFTRNHAVKEDTLSFTKFMNFLLDLKKRTSDIEIFKVNASCFEMETLPDGVRCAGAVRKLSVMPDGSAYPCNLFQHAPEYNLGNIFTDAFSKIWSNPSLLLFRKFNNNTCSITNCSRHSSCTGGCPAHAHFHGYDLQGMDIRCERQPVP